MVYLPTYTYRYGPLLRIGLVLLSGDGSGLRSRFPCPLSLTPNHALADSFPVAFQVDFIRLAHTGKKVAEVWVRSVEALVHKVEIDSTVHKGINERNHSAEVSAKSILPEENADQVLEYDGHLVAVEVSNPPKASPSATSVR